MVDFNNDTLEMKSMCSFQKINEKIFLGSIFSLYDNTELKNARVTHVLSCCSLSFPGSDAFIRLSFDINDICTENIYRYFKQGIEFIDKSKIVFVHCAAGISRSSSFVIAYLMWKERITFDKAKENIKKCRPCVNPNEGFVIQLKEFEKELVKNKYDLNKIDFGKHITPLY